MPEKMYTKGEIIKFVVTMMEITDISHESRSGQEG